MTWGESALWIVAPYVTLVILIGGLIWRHRYDRFGWTTRSSQLYEGRLLRVGSPLFHYGLLVVIVGHAIGLLIPASWILFVPAHVYHLAALVFGGIAGLCTVAGLALLIYRRRTTGPVFLATTRNDKLMFVLLGLAILAGLAATVSGVLPEQADYRETVSPWFRGIFVLQPDAEAMAGATTTFKIHVLAGMILFAVFPFTRLVHALSAPVGYLFRPYIVYRSR
ncbi:respiratory nitrate reductase subunit gamma [Nonomuraea sp. NPDC050536]|uniref:respiratory nitrate reductase subunit gamma n=1 Tax=Nonomuraea sp. NPDC050536 TaxID=3364366 RepID=UPI0037C6E2E7